MKMNELWKSNEQIEIEKQEREIQSLKDEIKKAREQNLINDTEVLAEMIMMSVMISDELTEKVMMLEEQIEVIQNESGR